MGTRIWDWDLGLGLGTGIGDWVWGLGFGTGIGYWDWGLGIGDWGLGIGDWEWDGEVTRWIATITTLESPTWSRRRLSTTNNF